MSDVVIYAKGYCPYCRAAKALLREKNVDFREIEVTHDVDLQAEMMARSGRRTVPQIFIDGRHIGGYDDLAAIDEAGELDALLKREPEAAQAA